METNNDLLAQIRESNQMELMDVERHQISFSTKKPPKHSFFRVHPKWVRQLPIYETQDDAFVVSVDLIPSIQANIKIKLFYPYVTRDGVVGFWGINRPDSDKKIHTAVSSALEASQVAIQNWIRIMYNSKTSSYDIIYSKENLGEPQWPNKDFDELLNKAFKNNFINSINHPEVRKLEGYGD